MIKESIAKKTHPLEGYNVDNNNFYYYNRYAKVVYYDPIFNTVDVLWLDNSRYGRGISLNTVYSSSEGFGGLVPSIGDTVCCSSSRGNIGSGSYNVTSIFPRDSEITRVHGMGYNIEKGRYAFAYNRIPEEGDVYYRSKSGVELSLSSDLILSDSSGTRLELVSSENSIFSSGRSMSYFGSGLYFNFGMNRVLPYLYSGDDELSINKLAPYELSPDGSNTFESKIEPVILEDGRRVYTATPDDSANNFNAEKNPGRPFVECDFFLEETSDVIPVAEGSSSTLHEDLLKPLDEKREKGHLIRFGFGTKLGKDPDRGDLYGRPIKRNVFKSEESEELEEDEKKKQEPIKEKAKHLLTTAFWINLFKKGKEIAFLELDKSGCLKFLLDGKKDEDGDGERYINSVEGRFQGRVKLSFGKHESSTGSSTATESTGDLPDFESNKKREVETDSVFGYFNSGLNLYVEGKDSGDGGYFLDCKEGANHKTFVDGQHHLQVEKEDKVLIKERSSHTMGKTCLRQSMEQSVYKSNNSVFGIKGNPLNLVSSSATGLINIGIGGSADLNDKTGAIEGTKEIIKAEKAGGGYTVNFGNLDVTIKTSGKVVFDCSEVNVGTSGLKPVGVKGSISRNSNADVHGSAWLEEKLADKLKVSGGSSSGGFISR